MRWISCGEAHPAGFDKTDFFYMFCWGFPSFILSDMMIICDGGECTASVHEGEGVLGVSNHVLSMSFISFVLWRSKTFLKLNIWLLNAQTSYLYLMVQFKLHEIITCLLPNTSLHIFTDLSKNKQTKKTYKHTFIWIREWGRRHDVVVKSPQNANLSSEWLSNMWLHFSLWLKLHCELYRNLLTEAPGSGGT